MDSVEMVAAAVPDTRQDAEEDAALDGHTTLPDVQQLGQMMAVVIPVEEENVPEACAEQSRDAAVDAEAQQ